MEPEGPRNIGSVARAMKNMGMSTLSLVNPCEHLGNEAYMMACNAKNILEKATVHKSLKAAIAKSSLVVGFTRRGGGVRSPLFSFFDILPKIIKQSKKNQVSLVFGRERTGLTNEELSLCPVVCYLDTSEKCPSLNLAQAVLLVCYEIYKANKDKTTRAFDPKFVSQKELDIVFKKISDVLVKLDFWKDDKLYPKIMKSFQRMFGRAGLERRDADMLLGVIKRILDLKN
jgi:TrmH family RNA methyltransferase